MAILTNPDTGLALNDPALIADYLAARGIHFTQWRADVDFAPDALPDSVLAAYASTLNPYMQSHGYKTADVIVVHSQTPDLPALRAKFLKEHTHSEDEVRFFVEGKGYFWFHHAADSVATAPEVFCVCCEAGDLLSVPAGIKHWFDLGPTAHVKAIRIFTDKAGWVPEYTNSGVEARYTSAAVSAQA